MQPCEPSSEYKPPLRGSEAVLTQLGSLAHVRVAEPRPPRCADCSGWLEPFDENALRGVRARETRFATWGRRDAKWSLQTWWASPWDVARHPPGSSVEVAHFGRAPEGTIGYGQWFHPLPGSDVWLNVGRRTLHARDKADAFKQLAPLWDASVRKRGLSRAHPAITAPEHVAAIVGSWVLMQFRREPADVLAFMAFELGFDSVQLDNRYAPDLVIVSARSVLRPECLRIPHTSSAWWPAVRYCGPRNRTCPFQVPLRTAALRIECACVERDASLINCDGSASYVVQGRT